VHEAMIVVPPFWPLKFLERRLDPPSFDESLMVPRNRGFHVSLLS